MHPFYPGIPSQNLMAALFQQGSGNFNAGVPNSSQAQMLSPAGFTPYPQNQLPFNNLMQNNGYVNRPAPPDYRLGNSVPGSAPMPHFPQQSHGGFNLPVPNPVSGPLMSGPFGGVVAQNSNPGQWQANSSMNGMNPNPGFMNGQFETQNLLQNVVNLLLQNPSQLNGLAQMAGCGNQFTQAVIPQNMALVGNPRVDLLQQIGAIQQQANLGQLNLPPSMPGVNQPMQMKPIPPTSGSLVPQQTLPMSLQANPGNQGEANVSNPNHRQNRPFKREANESKFNLRNKFQKTQSELVHETNANWNPERNHGPQTSPNESKGGKRRSLVSLYTPQEIQQWCEERKKNYPTKANVEKRQVSNGKSSEDARNEAKLRRERLQEILAKQAELGFEVPEIPSHYLSSPDPKGNGRGGTRPNNRNDRFQKRPFNKNDKFQKRPFNKNDRFQSRYNNKRKGYNNQHEQNECSTESREGNQNSFRKHLPNNEEGNLSKKNARKPSLLEKLLETDLKRDKSQLLQAFRFMVMNSFFDDRSLENTSELKFPQVIAKEDTHAVEGKESISEVVGCEAMVDGFGDDTCIHENAGAGKLDFAGGEQSKKYEAEEGELTE